MNDLHRTPLYDVHVDQGATMVDFAGWSMPIRYGSITEEHKTVRDRAGLFDLGHMGRIRIEGDDTATFVGHIVTNEVVGMDVGGAHYGLICQSDGGVLDDVIYYIRDRSILLVCNAVNRLDVMDCLNDNKGDYDVTIDDITFEMGMIAFQGPASERILAQITELPLSIDDFPYYTAVEGIVNNDAALVTRTGYTGEDGFEIYLPTDRTEALWHKLLEVGKDEDAKICGLGARDTLRTEAAMPLYGHEISLDTNPIEAGLGFAVRLTKDNFIGKEALAKIKEEGAKRKLVCFEVQGRKIARQGHSILDPETGDELGIVTSGTFSPTLEKPIGMGFVPKERAGSGTVLAVDVRGKQIPIQLVKRPFYKRERT